MAFTPVRTSTLRGDQKIGFDIYVEVARKHILYIRRGDNFEGVRLTRLKEKKVKKLHIREEDEASYRKYLTDNIEAAYDSKSSRSIETRGQIIHGLQQAAAEAVMEDPSNTEAYSSAKEGSKRFVDFILNQNQAIKGLLSVENIDQDLAHHAATVAAISVEIARRTGYGDTKNLPFLALGGLLHDLGHALSGFHAARPLSDFSVEELKIYHDHPAEGAKRLKDLKHMDLHVTQIIVEHEECINGSGFPTGLTGPKMNPLSIFVQSANLFDRLVAFEKRKAEDAIKHIFTTYLGRYPLEHLNALKAIAHS